MILIAYFLNLDTLQGRKDEDDHRSTFSVHGIYHSKYCLSLNIYHLSQCNVFECNVTEYIHLTANSTTFLFR